MRSCRDANPVENQPGLDRTPDNQRRIQPHPQHGARLQLDVLALSRSYDAAGILIDGGGGVAATEGQNVELQPGAVLRMRLDQPLVIRSTR